MIRILQSALRSGVRAMYAALPTGFLLATIFAWALEFAAAQPSRSRPATDAVEATPASVRAPVAPQRKADPQRAEAAYLEGVRLLDHEELAKAEAAFTKAIALNASRPDYMLALTLTRNQHVSRLTQEAAGARLTHHIQEADRLLAEARMIDPQNELVLQHDHAVATSRTGIASSGELTFAGPIQVASSADLKDIHLRGDVRQVVMQAAAAYGIKTVFDESVTSQTLRFDLEQSPYAQSMPILLRMAHLLATAVDPTTLLIAKDTQENRDKFERLVEETIYIPGSTSEQLNELSNIVKNVFDVRQIAISQGSGTLLLRAPETTLKAINYTLSDLIDGAAEVLLEVKLISIDKSRARNTGVNTPTSLGAFSVAAEAQQIVSGNQAIIDQAIASGAFVPTGNAANDLVTEALFLILSGVASDAKVSNLIAVAGHGLTLTGIYLGSGATLNLGLNSSEARALDDISVRVGDHQTTTLRVGSKYPITTSTYSSGLSSATAALLKGRTINGVNISSLAQQLVGSATTVPLVQFEDLGLTLKTTPTVLKSGLVSMHIDLKIEALTGASANNIPVLANRAFTSDITVQEGATVVMLSELSNTEAASVNGIPGLGELPGFQQTVADKLREVASSELVLLITPHLVRRRSGTLAGPRIAFNPTVPPEN